YVWRDVDDEGGTNIGVEAGVENLEGAMRRVGLTGSLHLRQAADKAGFVAQGGAGVVVGVAALPVRKDNDARTQPAKHRSYLQAVLISVLDIAIRKVEGFAVGDIEDACSSRGLCGTMGSGAPGAGFALSKVEDAGAPAVGVHGEERASAGLFHVVAVRGNGENV